MQVEKNKIGLIVCWYGAWPWYFNFFIHTVKYNLAVDFLIVTDEPITLNLPSNLRIINMGLQDIRNLARQKLGFDVAIPTPYKLCDFKPAYGLFFEEYLQGYQFWGHIDIDIIFGNIRYFIDDEILNTYDLVAIRHDFLTGYFTLFRNNELLNRLFEKSKDYRKVFTSEKHYCFDETNFKFKEFTDNIPYQMIKSEIQSMTHLIKEMQERKIIRAYFEFHVVEGAEGKLKWNKGRLFYKNEFEAILYHLILFKTKCKTQNIELKNIPDSFSIGRNEIIFNKKNKLIS